MKKEVIINEEIKATEIRLVQQDGKVEVMPTEKALKIAEDDGLDLIMVSPDAVPPVCKLMDYSKFMYEKAKKEKENKKKQKRVELKELRFSPNIDKHDLETKMNNAMKFLEKGDKVQFTILYRGREISRIDNGLIMLNDIAEKMAEHGKVEKTNIRSRNTISMILIPA